MEIYPLKAALQLDGERMVDALRAANLNLLFYIVYKFPAAVVVVFVLDVGLFNAFPELELPNG